MIPHGTVGQDVPRITGYMEQSCDPMVAAIPHYFAETLNVLQIFSDILPAGGLCVRKSILQVPSFVYVHAIGSLT